MSKHASLGFDVTTADWGSGLRTVARFQCVECGKTIDAPVQSGVPLNPESRAKWVGARGWTAKPFRKAGTYCPTCAGPSTLKNDTDSELRKVVIMPVPASPVIVREPTPDQRMRIRSALDKSFDDAAGMYLDEMSDQRVAELVGVPRIVVERMREAAYGPIKVNPIVAAARAEIADLKKALEGQQAGLDKLKVRLAEVSSKLEKSAAGVAA